MAARLTSPAFFTSFSKFQYLRKQVEKCLAAPSEGILQTGSGCSVITKLDKKHKTNSRQLLAGLKEADEVWQKIYGRLQSNQETSSREQSDPGFLDVCFDLKEFMDIKKISYFPKGFSFVDPPDKITAYQAAISVLSEVLQKETSWMREACCIVEAAMVGIPQKRGKSDDDLRQLQALLAYYRPIIVESNRLIDAEVRD